MATPAERVAYSARLILPIGLGLAAFVFGLIRGDVGIMAFGAGLIGAPSVIKAVSSPSPSPDPAPAPPVEAAPT